MKNIPNAKFPATRLRRPRAYDWVRRLVAECSLTPDNLIWPLFVIDGEEPQPIATMPNINRLPIKHAIDTARHALGLGIPAIALFPSIDPALRTDDGSHALDADNLICRATSAIKNAVPDIGIITDVALDPFTSHGHDGILRDGVVVNDETLGILTQQAITQSKAGADIIAPSDMMDGRVGAIRQALDTAGFQHIMIMSYGAKYASAFYGPFRDAVGAGVSSTLKGKDTYQMNPANSDEALREIALDIGEGADFIIIKPGLPYLDIIHRASSAFPIPIIAYQVSGEYAMIESAAALGATHRQASIMESLIALRRAGARAVLSYYAGEIAEWLNG